jgi:integrase
MWKATGVAIEGDVVPHPTSGHTARHQQADRLAQFRRTYTSLLHANGEDVKVVQELLRHGSARITMDVYPQAMTPAKRRAQGKVVAMLRDTEKKSS